MIRLTNLADYAVVLMCSIAQTDKRLSAQDLSASSNIPVPTVSKILNSLSRSGLLDSKRGLKGGFALSRPACEISVADIIESIDGPICMTSCVDSENGDCGLDQICMMRPRWQVINRAVRMALDNVKLSVITGPVDDLFLMEVLRRSPDAETQPPSEETKS